MNSRRRFSVALAGFVVAYFFYGVARFRLGVDFTDEGAYVAWPLRALFGERIFTGDPLLLLRPLFPALAGLYHIYPEISLFDLRLLGWVVHLAAFASLAVFLFRLSGAVLQSLLIASVPFFVCHIFGLAAPSYNSFSSDFLLLALSLRGLAAPADASRKLLLELAAAFALFVATIAHPALGVVAATILLHELFARNLGQNLVRRNLSPSNVGALAFVAGWLALGLYFAGSGALADWWRRLPLAHGLAGGALHDHPVRTFLSLAGYPFFYSYLAAASSAITLTVAAVGVLRAYRGQTESAARADAVLALLLIVSLIATFSYEPEYLPTSLVRVALIAVAVHCLRPKSPTPPEERYTTFLLLLSILAAALYATFTFYFSPQRSWLSGSLGLPFAFAVGLTLLLRVAPKNFGAVRLLVSASLALLVACVAREHYRNLYRDSAPADLDATFQLPKLRGIRSTAERVRPVEELYGYLHPRLARGEALLAFDDCPMLYFLLEARPAYGLTWAVRYSQDPVVLRQLDAELRAQPLPHFAIRTLVDISNVVWRTAPRTDYANYPLNETLLAHYALTQTIFPFEIWELKSARSLEKASPVNPSP